MSTPRKKRRQEDPAFDEALLLERASKWRAGIGSPTFATLFTDITTEFEHVEFFMERLLAILLGNAPDDTDHARTIYRTLRNPSTRLELLRAMIEKCPKNAKLGDEYDAVLSRYDTARQRRNDYVHGLWWTDDESRVFLAKVSSSTSPHPILAAVRVREDSLQEHIQDQRQFRDALILLTLKGQPPERA